MADWAGMILRVGEERGFWPKREIVTTADRFRPGASDVMALRVGYEKLQPRDGLGAAGLVGGRASRARSSGTPPTASAGSAASTGYPSARPRCRRDERPRHRRRRFLGTHLVERLRARRPRAVRRPTRRLRPDALGGRRAALRRREARARLPPRRRGRRDRRQPRQPRPLLVREPRDGRERARARAHARRLEARGCRHRLRLPEAHAGAVQRGRPLERLSRRRRTRPTAWRRSRSSSARRPTASSTARTRSSCCPRTSTARATTSTRRTRT